MKSFFRFIFLLIRWIVRVLVILGLIFGGYLLYQNFFNKVAPEETIRQIQSNIVDMLQETTETLQDVPIQASNPPQAPQPETVQEPPQTPHSQQTPPPSSPQPETPSTVIINTGPLVCYKTTCYHVEVADTPAQRQRGLMFRDNLAQNAGMLFIFETPSNYNFWMKNTKLTLDMIWINKQNIIEHIETYVPPCTMDPCPSYGPAQAQAIYVLEINGGEASSWRVGEQIILKNF